MSTYNDVHEKLVDTNHKDILYDVIENRDGPDNDTSYNLS